MMVNIVVPRGTVEWYVIKYGLITKYERLSSVEKLFGQAPAMENGADNWRALKN